MVKRERDPESSTNAGPHPSSPTPSPSPSLSPGPVAKKRRTKPSTPTNAKGSTKWDAADLLALLEEVFDFAHAKMEVQPIATRVRHLLMNSIVLGTND